MVNRLSRIVRFGAFEADLDAGELKKAGAPVRLQEQPFRLLTLLLERPGEVISREEVRQKLWPEDTFVDFDRSLNTAVNKLRDALGDSAEDPRFVQTLPRRGYRFIYPLPETAPGAKPGAEPPAAKLGWINLVLAGLAGVLLTALASFFVMRLRDRPAEAKLVTFTVPAPGRTTIQEAAVSPNGSRLVFIAGDSDGKDALWIRSLDSVAPHLLTGTEGASWPFWSPDSAFIAFYVGSRLYKIEASGGPVQLICDAGQAGGGTWARDGTILFTRSLDGVFRVPASGGIPQPFTKLDAAKKESRHYWPFILPDDRHFLYVSTSSLTEVRGLWVASLANPEEKHRLLPDVSMGVYSSGHLLFVRDRALMAQPFDLQRLELSQKAVPIVDRIRTDTIAGFGPFSASVNGVLAVLGGSSLGHLALGRLSWYDRSGNSLGPFGAAGRFQAVSLSPDETRVAVDAKTDTESSYQLFVTDPGRRTTTQVTFGTATGNFPVWSPDGARLAFGSNRDGFYNIYAKPSSGAGQEEVLFKNDANKFVYDWSHDGRHIIYGERRQASSKVDLWVLPMFGERKPVLYLRGSSEQREARFSPDGRRVAYASSESSMSQIYVQSFPAGSDKVQISIAGGTRPRWRADGKELYYVAPDGELMAVEVKAGPHFETGAPKPLFRMSRYVEHGYAPARSGQRFVMLAQEDDSSQPLTLTLNWTARLPPDSGK